MKVKKDLSMITLIFFITRCFYNLYTFTNLISFLTISGITLVLLIIIKKIKGNLQNIKFEKQAWPDEFLKQGTTWDVSDGTKMSQRDRC